MAGPEGSKYRDIFLKYHVWLETMDGDPIIEAQGFELLKELSKLSSITGASKAMGFSYRKSWDIIRQMEYHLGLKLVDKRRGGAHGGQTTLTNEGEKLLEAYNQLNGELDSAIHSIARVFFRRINDIKE